MAGSSDPAGGALRRRLALLAVCGIGAFFRTYQLVPPGLWGDDAINGLIALQILDGEIDSPFDIVTHSHSRFHALTNFAIAACFELFGPGLATLRLPGIVAGILCIPLLYGCIAPLFGSRAALAAALFFATSPLQINHSKVLLQVIMGQLFLLSAMCALVNGMMRRRRVLVALAGIPLALCVATYHSARLAPLVGFGFVALCAAHAWPVPRRWTATAAAALLLVFALTISPIASALWRHPEAIGERAASVSVIAAAAEAGSLLPLWDSLWRTLLVFHYEQGPVRYHWFGIGTDPALNPIAGVLVLFGLAAAIRAWREPRHALLLVWFAIGLAPGILSTEAPRVYRVLLASLPVFAWAGLALARLTERGRRAAVLAGVLAAASVAYDFNLYFLRTYSYPPFRTMQGEHLVKMARALQARGPGWVGLIASSGSGTVHESLEFLARIWGLQMRDLTSLTELLPPPIDAAGGTLLMAASDSAGTIDLLELLHPGLRAEHEREPAPRNWWLDRWLPPKPALSTPPPLVRFFAVPRGTPPREWPFGARALYRSGERTLQRIEPYPYFAFFPPPFPEPFTLRLTGTIDLPGPRRLVIACTRETEARLNGLRWPAAGDVVPAGHHVFDITVREGPKRLRFELRWVEPSGYETRVPPTVIRPLPQG